MQWTFRHSKSAAVLGHRIKSCLVPFAVKAKNPPDPCLFMSTAIALSFAGFEVQSFPVEGSKNKFSLLLMFSIFVDLCCVLLNRAR